MDIPSVNYKLVFEKNNTDEDFILFNDKEVAIRTADSITRALLHRSILGELNDMQSEVKYYDEHSTAFNNKFTIPDYFINLILQKYNMKILPI